MKNVKLGIGIGGRHADEADMIRAVKAAGFDACFTNWRETSDMEMLANIIAETGLLHSSVHGPFGKIETLWEAGETGDACLQLFPFDGIADWQGIMDRIVRHGYESVISFELTADSKSGKHNNDIYAAWDLETYFAQAYERAKQVVALAK